MLPVDDCPEYQFFTREPRDAFRTLLWDECTSCGGWTVHMRRALTSQQISKIGAKRRDAMPEACKCSASQSAEVA